MYKKIYPPLSLLWQSTFTFYLLCIISGCTSFSDKYPDGFTAPLDTVKVETVDFFPQDENRCGPASLAGVLNFYGVTVTPDEIAADIWRKPIHGTLSLDMVLYARKKGLNARWFSGNIDDIQKAISGGIPLITLMDIGFSGIHKYHYIVIVGFCPKGIIANSGKYTEKIISWDNFFYGWNRAYRWTLLISPINGSMPK
ncbi:MAG: C39 family peptidase [Thermodesulfobacteriota bacterium]|nr:C39 family peptidase [Thermodesulfobacteriota bacterium]